MFKPDQYLDIPNVDLLSWTFGNTDYGIDKPIYIDAHDDSNRISYRQAKSHVRKLIAGLQARGLQPGDSVCLHSFNNFSYSLVYLAAIGAGGCFVGSNPAYTKFELNHLFSISRVRFIVVEPELLEKILPALKECGIPQSSVFVFDTHGRDTPDGFESWDVLLEYGEKDWESFDNEERSKSTPASLVSTSGTTGLPKAATISHYSLISQNVIMYDSRDKPYETLRLIGLPQFHSFAVPLVHIAPLREGHPTYIMRRYDTDQYVEYIDRYQITETSMVTPIVLNCINLSPSRMRCLGSLRFIWAGGAPLNASVQRQLKEKLHQECIFSQVWGLSEYGWITVFPYPETHIGSVGRLLPSTEAKIVDEDGEDVSGDGQGEVLIRGPSLMTSYLANPVATRKTIVDGWLQTGDIGYQNDGNWFLVDRAKDLIKVRGWQVSPTELETHLLMHPTITDAAVIGVDFSDGRGELPRAYLVIDPTSSPTITDGEIHNHMSGHLAKYKALAGGIERLDAIPRSASGKILKRILREKAELWRPSSCEMAIVRTKSRTAAPRGRPPPGEAPSEKEISKTEDCQLAANAVHAPESDASESTLYGGHGHGHDTIGSTAGKRKHLPGAGTAEVCGSRQSKKTKTGISAR